jgi:hypothetical protein
MRQTEMRAIKPLTLSLVWGVTAIACHPAATDSQQPVESRSASATGGGGCVFDTDCPAPLVCASNNCTTPPPPPGQPGPICSGCNRPFVCQPGGICACPEGETCGGPGTGGSGGGGSGGIEVTTCVCGCRDDGEGMLAKQKFLNYRYPDPPFSNQNWHWTLATISTYVQRTWCTSTCLNSGPAHCAPGPGCEYLKDVDTFDYLGPADGYTPPDPPLDWSEIDGVPSCSNSSRELCFLDKLVSGRDDSSSPWCEIDWSN